MGHQLHPSAIIAGEQHGIVTHPQLLRAGATAKQIAGWVRRGRLIRVHRGVYAVGHLPPSPHARTMAAVLACGPTAVLSHRSAANLWA
jgi:predicted transcriptional regulator of viral defense system